MIKIYNCLVEPKIYENNILNDDWLRHRMRKGEQKLSKWFYFYCVDPIDPITIYYHLHNPISIGPGQNRCTGIGLRDNTTKIKALLATTIDTPIIDGLEIVSISDLNATDIKVGKQVKVPKLSTILNTQSPDLKQWFDRDQKYKASISSSIPIKDKEQKELFPIDWIKENLKYTWVLEDQDFKAYVNQGQEIKGSINVQDHPSVKLAVQALFRKIVETEFNSLA